MTTQPPKTFTNQICLVTGASRGIGRSIAVDLAVRGCFVYINYNSNKDAAQNTLDIISQKGGNGQIISFSVANANDSEKAVTKIIRESKKIDILINNAGITKDGLLMRMKPESWHNVMDVNLNGFFNVTKPVIKSMLGQKYGRVVNITSTSGQAGQAGQVNYSASKSGIIGATKALAKEMAARNITVNAVAPGFIDTEMTQRLDHKRILSMVPAGRLGTCKEVAQVVSFLSSPQASYVTGQVIGVNGGMY